jgi:A/G-specific adenine glycosylase
LELAVFRAHVSSPCRPPPECWWAPPQSLPGEALPSVMKKAIEAAVPGATRRPTKRRGGPEARPGQNNKGIR